MKFRTELAAQRVSAVFAAVGILIVEHLEFCICALTAVSSCQISGGAQTETAVEVW